jgi:short subunit dehydrogenase-like uncharacterized protein
VIAAERPYDIVLFGATGFVGRLTAEYLAEHAGDGTRWAVAGRSKAKLEELRFRLAALRPELGELPLVIADIGDGAAVRAMAESARVVITSVGPYINYGEPVVAACASAGTDYVDITGEPEFVDLMWLRYHREAETSGARLVHSCGFDSIPYDLGALWTVNQLRGDAPIALQGFGRIGGGPSAGSFHSAVHILARLRQGAALARQRRAQESTMAPGGRRVHGVAGRPHRSELAGGWVVPAPTIDPRNVLRSARVLDAYGPDFSYAHYMVTGSLAATAAVVVGVGGLAALAQLRPTRKLLLRLRQPGEGPSADQRARARFRVRMVADASGRRLVTEVSGGDPAGAGSAKMLAESALCLAFDALPSTRGQVTPAVAMGQALIDRLSGAGIEFRIVSESG